MVTFTFTRQPLSLTHPLTHSLTRGSLTTPPAGVIHHLPVITFTFTLAPAAKSPTLSWEALLLAAAAAAALAAAVLLFRLAARGARALRARLWPRPRAAKRLTTFLSVKEKPEPFTVEVDTYAACGSPLLIKSHPAHPSVAHASEQRQLQKLDAPEESPKPARLPPGAQLPLALLPSGGVYAESVGGEKRMHRHADRAYVAIVIGWCGRLLMIDYCDMTALLAAI